MVTHPRQPCIHWFSKQQEQQQQHVELPCHFWLWKSYLSIRQIANQAFFSESHRAQRHVHAQSELFVWYKKLQKDWQQFCYYSSRLLLSIFLGTPVWSRLSLKTAISRHLSIMSLSAEGRGVNLPGQLIEAGKKHRKNCLQWMKWTELMIFCDQLTLQIRDLCVRWLVRLTLCPRAERGQDLRSRRPSPVNIKKALMDVHLPIFWPVG